MAATISSPSSSVGVISVTCGGIANASGSPNPLRHAVSSVPNGSGTAIATPMVCLLPFKNSGPPWQQTNAVANQLHRGNSYAVRPLGAVGQDVVEGSGVVE